MYSATTRVKSNWLLKSKDSQDSGLARRCDFLFKTFGFSSEFIIEFKALYVHNFALC